MNNLYSFMKRYAIALFTFWICVVLKVDAQSISNYQFSTSTNASLNRSYGSFIDNIDMNSGMSVLLGGSIPAPTMTSSVSYMPFDFYINGTRLIEGQHYFYVSNTGWIVFNHYPGPNQVFNSTSFNLPSMRLAPFLGDMGTSSIGNVTSKVFGEFPNRILVIEFLRMSIPSGIQNDTNTFQARLYENNGAIEYVYGRMKNSSTENKAYNIGFLLGNSSGSAAYYQHVNTATHTVSTSNNAANVYPPGYIADLSGTTNGSLRSYMWIPKPTSSVSSSITFSNITSTSMRLEVGNPIDELGFVIYRSIDGINYTYVGLYGANTTSAATTSFTITNLIANTTYYWRVHPFRESLSDAIVGEQATLPASRIYTIGSGNWSNAAIWNTGTVPTAQDSAEISVGDNVVLNQVINSCGTLIVKGKLTYGSVVPCNLYVNGDLLIEDGGELNAGTSIGGANINQNLFIGSNPTAPVAGNLKVDGILNLETTNNVLTTFYGKLNAKVYGTGTVCKMPFIKCEKGLDTTSTLEFLRTYTQSNIIPSQNTTQRLWVSSGTLKLSAPIVTKSFFGNTLTLAYNTLGGSEVVSRLWLNHSGIELGMADGVTNMFNIVQNKGHLLIEKGKMHVGIGSTNFMVNAGAILTVLSDSLYIDGSLYITQPTSALDVAGGNIIINPQAVSENSSGVSLNIGASTPFNFSGGSIVFVNPFVGSSFASVSIPAGANKSITGGAFVFGTDAANAAGGAPVSGNTGFGINCGVPIHDLIVNNKGNSIVSRYLKLASDLTINGTLTIHNNGYLAVGNGSATAYKLIIKGNIVNNGVLSNVIPGATTPRSGVIELLGSTNQLISGTGTAEYLNIKVSNPLGVTFSNTGVWGVEKFTLEQGNVSNAVGAIRIGGTSPAYNGSIIIGGLNESTAAGSFSALPTIVANTSYEYGPASNTLSIGAFNEMAVGAQTLQNLKINDQQGVSVSGSRNITVTGTLNLTNGNFNIGNNNLTIGVSTGLPGILNRGSGFVVLGSSGSFTRWFNTTNPSYSYNYGFPLSTGNYNRSILFSGNLTSGCNLTVRHSNENGYTDIAPFVDNGITINRRSNSYWILTGSVPGFFGSFNMRIICEGIGTLGNPQELVACKTSSALEGTSTAGTGTLNTPDINKIFTTLGSLNNILGNNIHIGANAVVNPLSPTITAINTGNWNDPNTWEGGIIPTIINHAYIATGVTVTIPASYTANCNGLTITSGATVLGSAGNLNNAGNMFVEGTFNNTGTNVNIVGGATTGIVVESNGELAISGGTVNLGPMGGSNRRLTLLGKLNVSGGTLFVNGVINVMGGSHFIQSGGDIKIDANDGTAAGSALQGEHLLSFIAASTINCSGGTITIIDPPFVGHATGTTMAVRINTNLGSLTAFSGTHSIQFGDGLSNTPGNANGFILNTKSSSSIQPIQHIIVNGGSTTGRWVSDGVASSSGTYIKGNVTINAGSEFRHTSALVALAIGGNIINNGLMTTSMPLTLGGEGYAMSNLQEISGTGTFRNSLTTSTGAFTNLTINGGGLVLNTTNVNFGISGVLNIGALKITTNNNSIFLATPTASISRTSGYIVGNLGKTFPVGSTSSYTYEIGTASDYLPVTVSNPVVTKAGVLTFGTYAGAHPELSSSCINPSKMINRYWKTAKRDIEYTGGNFTFNFLGAELLGSANLTSAKTFAYTGTEWDGAQTGTGTATSYTINGLNLFGDMVVGEITPIPTSVTISSNKGTTVCQGAEVKFSAVITNAGKAPTYQWKVNGINVVGQTDSVFTTSSLVTGDQVSCSIVSNHPCVLSTSANSNIITITVNPPTVAGDVTGGASVCTASTSGLLTLSGYTGSIVRWQYAITPFLTWNDTAITTSTFVSGPLSETTRYRAVVKNGICDEAFSDTTEVVVDAPSYAPNITGSTSVCVGVDAGTLTLPVAGTVGAVVRWESSTDPAFASNINGSITSSNTFSAGVISTTTYYRAIVKNGNCAEIASPVHTITITGASVAGTLSGNQSMCVGGTVSALTLSGNTGSVVKWQSSTNASFSAATDIANTTTSYTPSTPGVTTYYRAIVSNMGCNADTSNAVTITINATPGGGTINGPSSVCLGNNAGTLTLQGTYNGTIGNWQYQTAATAPAWQNTTTSGNTQHAAGVLSVPTKFRVQFTSAGCPDGYSSEITIGIDTPAVVGSISGTNSVCSGTSGVQLTATGYTGNIVGWLQRVSPATTYTLINNTSNTLTTGAITAQTDYRVIVKRGNCNADTTAAHTITITGASVAGTLSGNQSMCVGGTVSALTLSGNTGSVVKWQSSTNASFSTATDIANTTTSYTPSTPGVTTYYRAIVSNMGCNADTSNAVTITINATPGGGTINGPSSVCLGNNAGTLTLQGTYNGTIGNWQYQTAATAPAWQNTTTSGNTQHAAGVLSVPTKFRVQFTSAGCPDGYSSEITIGIDTPAVVGSISGTNSVCSGTSGVQLTATGYTGNIVGWLQRVSPATTYTLINNTSNTLTTGAITAQTDYRVIVKRGNCNADTTAAHTISLNAGSVGGSVTSPVSTICSGNTSGLLSVTGKTGTVIGWLMATAPFTTYTSIASASGDTYTSGALASTTRFRAIVQSASCTADTSAYFEVVVNNAANAGTLTNNGLSAYCEGSTGPSLQLSSYTGTITKWEVAYAPNFIYSDISGATSAIYNTGVLTRTAKYKVSVNNTGCTPATSNEITITVDSATVPGTATASSITACSGVSPSQISVSGMKGNIERWEYSIAPFTTWTTTGSSSNPYQPSQLSEATQFRAVVKNGACSTANTNVISYTVTPGSDAGSLSGNTPICSGGSASLSITGTNIISWQKNTGTGWVAATGTFFPPSDYLETNITTTTKFRAIAQNSTCPADTTNEFEVAIMAGGLWTGLFNSNWSSGGNWCGGVPTSTTDVVIPSGTLNSPRINVAASVKNITIEAGANLAFASANTLTINGSMEVNGAFNTASGTVVYQGNVAADVAGIVYEKLTIAGSGVKTLSGNATVTNTLDISAGTLQLGNNDLVLNGALTGASSSSYLITNGTGSVKRFIPLTTPFTFPVGSGSYTPVTITNNGTTADTISVKVLPHCYNSYSGSVGSSPMSNQNVVDRTFVINESTNGGSSLNIEFNWNAGDEQAAMDKTKMVVGHYTTVWNHATTSPQDISSSPYRIVLNNQTTLGIFGVGDITSPLPVRLLTFTAKLNKGVSYLHWVTASETNNSHFELERSVDGIHFEKIATLQGKGNSGKRVQYDYADEEAVAFVEVGYVVYYRLKQFNFDGDSEYSGVVSVSDFKNAKLNIISTIPNPFASTTTITYKASSISPITYTVNDAFGKTMEEGSWEVQLGANTLEIGKNNQWSAGVYFVKIIQGSETKVVKIIKN